MKIKQIWKNWKNKHNDINWVMIYEFTTKKMRGKIGGIWWTSKSNLDTDFMYLDIKPFQNNIKAISKKKINPDIFESNLSPKMETNWRRKID